MPWLKIKRKLLGLEVDTETFFDASSFFPLFQTFIQNMLTLAAYAEGCEIIKSHCPILTSARQ